MSSLSLSIYIYIYKEIDIDYIYIYIYISTLSLSLYIYIYIYAPPWGLSTLAKELLVAAYIMQSSSKELSTLVADRV